MASKTVVKQAPVIAQPVGVKMGDVTLKQPIVIPQQSLDKILITQINVIQPVVGNPATLKATAVPYSSSDGVLHPELSQFININDALNDPTVGTALTALLTAIAPLAGG